MKNIVYQTDQIARNFTQNRVRWDQFYESERFIINQLPLNNKNKVLDIGCGCGGLGLVLKNKFGIDNYTGVEINVAAAKAGQAMNPNAKIICGDVLELNQNQIHSKRFDVVFSLSCVDWNIRFSDMLTMAWHNVCPGGYLVATFRLTIDNGCDDIKQSYQYISYDGKREGEIAPYVVLNAKNLFQQLSDLNPSDMTGYGYWGAPSSVAVTPYEKLCFVAISLQKKSSHSTDAVACHLDLPAEIISSLEISS